MDLPWLLVGGEAFGYESAELFFQLPGCNRTFAKDDKGDWNLARGLVRTSDHAAIANRRVFEQQSFDLGGSYRKALVFDHLLAAIDDVKKVVGVTSNDVARPEPSIAQHRGRGLRVFPVAHHELRTAHDQFAGLAGSNLVFACVNVHRIHEATFGLHQWLSDGLRLVEFGLKVSDMRNRGGLGHAIALAHQNS